MDKLKVYFPNLNGLRFIAAFLVIIHHIEQFKSWYNIDTYWGKVPFIDIIGKLGVILFFVLSGFLITYLLLFEEYNFKKINIKKFYIRRIIRIWPLYFLIVILAFFVLPNFELFILPNFDKEIIYSNLFLKLFLYAIFLPNLVLTLLGIIPYASHTWTIGTEEQFYLVWPVLLKYFKKNRIYLMFFIVVFYTSFKFFINSSYSNFIPFKNIITAFWSTFNIDCMAIGGIFSILLFQKNKILSLFRNNILFYSILIITIALLLRGVNIPIFHYQLYAILFAIIILNFATNKSISLSLENKYFNYLGKISYGLYMYHPIAIVFILYIFQSLNLLTNWIIYPSTIITTILLAGFSYKYIESPILKHKEKFSNIIKGNEKK